VLNVIRIDNNGEEETIRAFGGGSEMPRYLGRKVSLRGGSVTTVGKDKGLQLQEKKKGHSYDHGKTLAILGRR